MKKLLESEKGTAEVEKKLEELKVSTEEKKEEENKQ